jgi:L-fucose isomerase-like protein
MRVPKIGFVTCVHPIYDLPSVIQHRDDAVSALEAVGCELVSPPIARNSRDVDEIAATLRGEEIDLLLFFFCTWVAEEITLALARELKDAPLLLWALPYLDRNVPMPSPVTGLTATGCNIRRMGRSFSHMIGAVTPERINAVKSRARVAAVIRSLRRARFGLIGSPCPGMIDTGCDESLLHDKLGVTAVHRDLDNLLSATAMSSESEASLLAAGLLQRVGRSEVSEEKVAEQYRMFLGLKFLVEQDRMDGVSVRCWPELRDHHRKPACFSLGEMAQSGVPTACEADLTSLVTSYILTQLAGQPSYSFDITAYLDSERALQFAHCGSAALSLAESPDRAVVRGHMRTGAGALVEFPFKPGVATIAKLLRPSSDKIRMFVSRGEVIPTPAGVRGSVATVRVEPSPDRFLEVMLREAVEHHVVLVYGDWTSDLEHFCDMAGVSLIPCA